VDQAALNTTVAASFQLAESDLPSWQRVFNLLNPTFPPPWQPGQDRPKVRDGESADCKVIAFAEIGRSSLWQMGFGVGIVLLVERKQSFGSGRS
jgi:hypothetical protein